MSLSTRNRGCHRLTAVLMLAVSLTITASADQPSAELLDYFAVDVEKLVADFGPAHIVSDPPIIEASFYQMDTAPHIDVPANVEAYLLEPPILEKGFHAYRIVGSKPRGSAISGKLFVLRRHPDQPRQTVLAKFDFHVAATPSESVPRDRFLAAKGRHFQRLWSEQFAGAAMFRHLATASLAEVNEVARSTGPSWPLRNQSLSIDSTIQLFSGGRAISENLQLDAALDIAWEGDSRLKPLSQVPGIQVRPIDWAPLLQDQPTELDALAKLIPHDQYAVFLPSFDALAKLIDRSSDLATPLALWLEPQSRKTNWINFYQAQLGLPLTTLTRQVGAALIEEVAITGSDPYFRTGTDVAVLVQSDQTKQLFAAMSAQITEQANRYDDAVRVDREIGSHRYVQWATPDRQLCSLIAELSGGVVVTNSLYQMTQILNCLDQPTSAMQHLDEYRFFRQRYPRSAEQETALVVITDAAIRRWCGPQWRISASRRTRARATLAELTAQHADELVGGQIQDAVSIQAGDDMPDAGTLHLEPRGVRSEQYGTLAFQTPIAEMLATHASELEIDMYRRWRDEYERRWSAAFDPIAIQVALTEDRSRLDVSVIPLAAQTQYRLFSQLVGDLRLNPEVADPHQESLASLEMALDTNSPLLNGVRGILADDISTNLLSWIDGSVRMYFDHDPEWVERLEAASPWALSRDEMLQESPVAFFIPSQDNLRMTACMVAVRAALEQAAPNMTRWSTGHHQGFEYAIGSVTGSTDLGGPEDLPRCYYVTTPLGLTVSSNLKLIERVIDRQLVKPADSSRLDVGDKNEAETASSVGPQVRLQITGRGADLITRSVFANSLRRANRLAWSNLPILNYFRHRYPDRDPADVYKTLFGETLVEPSGGDYVWNQERGTYVSTLHGYHLEPKAGPSIRLDMRADDELNAELEFQNAGLRAKLSIPNQ